MSIPKINILILGAIIALSAIFYFWQLDRNDVVTDEASYMARGMKMLDFNFGIEQPTPIQWVISAPWWMKLSFHDHPLLVFFFEYLSFKSFGENIFAGRTPAALAGVVSVVLLYLIGRELYSKSIGVISALFFAVTVGHVWISRVALQESIVIALMLAAAYCFIRSFRSHSLPGSIVQSIGTDAHGTGKVRIKNGAWFLAAAVLTGISFLAKYTAFILAPVFLTIFIILRRDYLKSFYFPLSIFCLLVFVSPVIIYNIGLYQNFGHFDFQFSYVFGQNVAAWSDMPGKEEIGSFGDRFRSYLPTLFRTNSPFFLLLSFGGLFLILRRAKSHIIFLSFFLWLAVFMVVIGPTERFLTMLVPWLSLAAGFFVVHTGKFVMKPFGSIVQSIDTVGCRRFFTTNLIFAFIVIFEIFYSYNSAIALSPVGGAPWAYAAEVRRDNYNWGYNQLEDFISTELAGKRPEVMVSFDYPVIAELLDRTFEEDVIKNLEPEAWMFVYNGNQALGPQLWTFLRRAVYHGWPIADAETYRRVLAENGRDYFERIGVREVYFVQNTENVLAREVRRRSLADDGDIFENELKNAGVKPYREIKNFHGETAFLIYRFSL